MYALRERRVHVTQEDFEMAVAKVQGHIFRPLLVAALEQWGWARVHWVSNSNAYSPRSCKRTVRKTCPSRNYGSEADVLCVDPLNKALPVRTLRT